MTGIFILLLGIIPSFFGSFTKTIWGNLLQLLLMPLGYGTLVAFLDNVRNGEPYRVRQLFRGFNEYGRILGTGLLVSVYTLLWTLLLIVPGIVKSYSYSMTYYVLRDHPELRFNGAINRSMAMMEGHKFDLFYLHLTFLGWGLLFFLPLWIGFMLLALDLWVGIAACLQALGLICWIWLYAYVCAAQAHFYEDVKAEYEAKMP